MKPSIKLLLIPVVLISLVLLGFSEWNKSSIKSEKVWGVGRSSEQNYIVNYKQEKIPSSVEEINKMSDDTMLNVNYLVIYKENKWFKKNRKLIKTIRFERKFPEGNYSKTDTKYYRLVDEMITAIDENHSVFVRLYERYLERHDLWFLEPESMIIPKVQSVPEAKEYIKGNNPEFLKLLPITIVENEVLSRWIQEQYDPVNEYTIESPKGLTLENIINTKHE